VTATLYFLSVYIKHGHTLHIYFAIWLKYGTKYVRNAIECLNFSEKGKGRPYFSYGRNLDYIYMLTVKVYDILYVKKALVVS
jgi:hypothetical protein